MELGKDISAVVSGGASGMGAAAVRALRALGVRVSILDRDATRGEAVAEATGAMFVHADVSDDDSVVRAFDLARSINGQERILIHTPAIGSLIPTIWRDAANGSIQRHDFDRFQEIVRVNLGGTFLCASVSAAGMATVQPGTDGERGVIVMTSSIASTDAPAGASAYVASKAGINGMTLSMARDLAPLGIRINTILPGSFDTPMNKDVPKDFLAHMTSWTLHPKRLGRAEEFASMALEYIRNPYLNATLLRLDGGAYLGRG